MTGPTPHGSPNAGANNIHAIGSIALWLSLLTFAIYFLNVLVGGTFRMKPWMSDLGEMLTLALAVVFFVAGTIARERERNEEKAESKDG